MTDENEWEEQFEDDGVTLGPEEALRREIEKSKSLKVERLKLRDENEKLRAQTARLKEENEALRAEIGLLKNQRPATSPNPTGADEPTNWFACLSPLAIISILCGAGLLFYFLFR
jgi:hypothetical protein